MSIRIIWLPRVRCFFLGHADVLRFDKRRMFLACVDCGRESVGWCS